MTPTRLDAEEAAHQPPEAAVTSVPVVEERLAVDGVVREIGAVRVRVEAERREQPLTLERLEEHVVVERVPVRRVVEERQDAWLDGDTWVVPVYAEVPVTEHRLMLVEEVRLRRETTSSSTNATVALTRQCAVVERRQSDGSWVAVDPRPG